MPLFPRKKQCEVTYLDQYFIVIRGQKWHSHDYELEWIKKSLISLHKKIDNMAATLADFKASFAEINEATTNIANDIARLAGQIGTGGLTDAEETEALDELKAISEKLKAIAATTPDGTPTPPPAG